MIAIDWAGLVGKTKKKKTHVVSHGRCFLFIMMGIIKKRERILKTDLNERDEDDEEGRWTARITVGVIFALPIVRQELVGNHLHHSAFSR